MIQLISFYRKGGFTVVKTIFVNCALQQIAVSSALYRAFVLLYCPDMKRSAIIL